MNEEQHPLPFEPREKKQKNFFARIRRNFVTGLFVIAPLAVTYWLIQLVVLNLDGFLYNMIPGEFKPRWYVDKEIPGIGLIAGFLLLTGIGMFARNVIGKSLMKWVDNILYAVPGVRTVYGAVKQVTDTLQNSSSRAFKDVVLVEYPRKGIWCIAFVTGETEGEIQYRTDQSTVSIFLPTTPNPTSGFLLFVPKDDVIDLDMTVDEAMKLVISGGIVVPDFKEPKKPKKKS